MNEIFKISLYGRSVDLAKSMSNYKNDILVQQVKDWGEKIYEFTKDLLEDEGE